MASLLLRATLAALVSAGASGCSQLFFYPSPALVRTPADLGLVYEEIHFTSSDGARLNGWYLPAASDAARDRGVTVVHLHGNAENMSTHIGAVRWLPREGFAVFLFDYRGYGRSSGRPSVGGALDDSRAALAAASSLANNGPLVVFGQSLGGALAVRALVDSPQRDSVSALIVDSAFADYRLIVGDKLASTWLTWPLQPLSWLMGTDHSPVHVIEQISPIPLLLIHAELDPVVPAHHSRLLFERAREPKTLWILQGDQHAALTFSIAGRQRLLGFLRSLED